MLSVLQAAERVRRDPETIRRWIRSGRLKASKVGRAHLIDEADLDAASTERRMLPVPESWKVTVTGEPMPDVLAELDRQRAGR